MHPELLSETPSSKLQFDYIQLGLIGGTMLLKPWQNPYTGLKDIRVLYDEAYLVWQRCIPLDWWNINSHEAKI